MKCSFKQRYRWNLIPYAAADDLPEIEQTRYIARGGDVVASGASRPACQAYHGDGITVLRSDTKILGHKSPVIDAQQEPWQFFLRCC